MKNKTLIGEILAFVFARKAYWLLPAILLLMLLMVLAIIGSSPVAMYIYPMV